MKSRIKNKGVDSLTIMQVLQLVYCAHGWSLDYSDIPLVQQSPKAWVLAGAVYPENYDALSKQGKQTIKTLILDKENDVPYESEFSDNKKKL